MGATRADLSRCKRLSAHKTKVFTPWLFTGKVCRQHARPQRHTISYFLVQLYEAHPIITPILEMRNEAQRHEKTLAHCWEGGKLKNSKALYPEPAACSPEGNEEKASTWSCLHSPRTGSLLISLKSHKGPGGSMQLSLLTMKPRSREVKGPAQGHTARK